MGETETNRGLAVLVGAGPGEESLITLAGAKWLSLADVVLYDRLAGEALLRRCRDDAEKVYVGKAPGRAALSQEQINALLVESCRAGRLVVRLKGGDPLVFGRGGEEAKALRDAGVRFRIVPGVTAASAAAAYAGIPLTDRRCASSVALVTGHEDPAKSCSTIDFGALVGIDTVVFYMGVGHLGAIAEGLIGAGKGGQTPVAIIERAAAPQQRVTIASLATAAAVAEAAGVRPPAIILVGQVAHMHEELGWFEHLPLFGRTVVVTRARRQSSELAERLAELGANVLEAPTIEILPPLDAAPVDAALRRVGEFDWVVLTSPNGVEGVFARLEALGLDARALAGVKVAAIGPATAEALHAAGIRADLVPGQFTTAALAEALRSLPADQRGSVLLARADIATPLLPECLAAAGSRVEQVAVYRTARPDSLPQCVREAFQRGEVDWITFTSSSTVENMVALIQRPLAEMPTTKMAVIGPVTGATLRAAAGVEPTVQAEPHTIDALVAAMARSEAPRS